MLMSKGMKSLQLSLNEVIPKLDLRQRTVSNVAYSKARLKLKHTAFVELNQEAVVRVMYQDGDYQTSHDLRILAVDGSQVMLPTTPEIKETFGSRPFASQRPDVHGEHCYGLASVLYDVLNRVAISAQLLPGNAYEVDAAASHLELTKAHDLVIYDRGYCSFRMMALASQAQSEFLIRCHAQSFKVSNEMLAGKGPDDVVCTIPAPKNFTVDERNQQLPTTVTVRFVRVMLDSGEYEVLATSLLDQSRYPLAIFKELYYLRWGIETFYGVLKTRLNLENFSGQSVESIRQDFYVAIFLTGVEAILTADAEVHLSKQFGGIPKKVNKAVSFNVIKNRTFELFISGKPAEQTLEELTDLFLTNPTRVRKDRKPPRKQISTHKKLHFWRRKRKEVF